MIVVSDSSPLISLAKIQSFDLFQKLYGIISISSEVHAEVVLEGATLSGAVETSGAAWIQVQSINRPLDVAAAKATFGLGLGELSTLLLARQIGADLVILDDLRARKLAQSQGFRVQGTIGILETCFLRGHLTNLRAAYAGLLERGVFLNLDLLDRSLESCGLPPLP